MGSEKRLRSGLSKRTSLVDDPDNVNEAYRQLAVAIVHLAVEDYIKCLVRPNYEAEVELIHDHWLRGIALKKLIATTPAEQAEEARLYILDSAKKAYATGLFPKTNRHCNILGIIKRLESPCTIEELRFIVYDYRRRVGQINSIWNEKNARRIAEKPSLEKFFRSEAFILYTGGLLEPDELIAECERRAKSGEWHIDFGGIEDELYSASKLQPLR